MSQAAEAQRPLIVLLHGFGRRPSNLESVRVAALSKYPNAEFLIPKLAYWQYFAIQPMAMIAGEVVDQIDAAWADALRNKKPFDEILLVGHSCGALLARKIAIIAHGERTDAPFEPILARHVQEKPWAPAIRRLVLLAGITRGWMASSALHPLTSFFWSLGGLINGLLLGKATIYDAQRGSRFVVQTRLQWLALTGPTCAKRPDFIVVQLLGTVDDVVSPDDGMDFAIDLPNGGYFFIEIQETGHRNAVDLSLTRRLVPSWPLSTAEIARRQRRKKRFLEALTCSTLELENLRIEKSHMADTMPPAPELSVENVAFIIHGIRDKGFWTQKIARVIKKEAEDAGLGANAFRCVTASYGYFAMAPFILPWIRRQKVAWLMEQYVEARARYPKARFHYVGHSNGTYLVARALEDHPLARFDRLVLAGSVVRCGYNWNALAQAGRVSRVLNYVATYDWVVAIFPKALQPFSFFFDLGSAGHDGFDRSCSAVTQFKYVVGAHSAALKEAQWDDIARFIVKDIVPDPLHERESHKWLRYLLHCISAIAPLLVLGAVALAAWAPFWFWRHLIGADPQPIAVASFVIGVVAYVTALRIFVTKV
jgi:alpha-beta hydrolase superfamily lysophospholipase